MHISGIANTVASLLDIVSNLNIKESNRTKLSASVLTFFIDDLFAGSFYYETRINICL